MSSFYSRRGVLARHEYLIVPAALFIILLVSAVVRSPNLFTGSGMAGAILVAAPLILATLALTPIVMAGRGSVDLAVGPLIGFINVTIVQWLVGSGMSNPVLVFCWALLIGVAYQVIQALVIVYVRVAPVIVMLSGYLFLTGVNLIIMPRAGGLAPDWMASWAKGTEVFSPVLFFLLAGLVVWYASLRTAFQNNLRMTGADERAAYASGVRVLAVRIGAHVLGGVFAGLAAICHTALISSGDPVQSNSYTLQAITALVLGGAALSGGRGSAVGSLLGALNMYLISHLLATFNFGMFSGFVTQLSFGLILVISLLVNVFLIDSRSVDREVA
jgi:ribose transport system permease protein